jgi:hypothetical protein
MKKSKKIVLISISVLSIFFLLLLGSYIIIRFFFYSVLPESYIDEYKSALPKTATNISDKFIDAYPDWSYYLKAKISQEEFNDFVKNLKLDKNNVKKIVNIFNYDSTKFNNSEFNKRYMKQFEGMDWWKVTNKNNVYYAVHYHKNTSSISSEEFATYEEGYLYFRIVTY